MKNLITTSLSVLALAMTFTGCGDSGSVSSANSAVDNNAPTEIVEQVISNGDTTDTTITNEFGLNPSLGIPPPLPAS